MDNNSITQALINVCDFIVTRGVDLEAEFARIAEAPIPNLHVVATRNRIVATGLGLTSEARG